MFGFGKPVITNREHIQDVLTRGVAEVINRDHLEERMQSGDRLRIKLGIDPTSPNLHLGRSVPLLKMRDFQELGHQPVLIVGDVTGVIGDTSDKKSERPMLSRDEVRNNAETYFDQITTILGHSFEKHYNSEWLDKLSFSELGEMADQFSVADFIARDNIRRRLEEGSRVSLRETLYPLMQGYDSVAIKADVEIGGVDQRFNLLAGRALQEHHGQQPQSIVMTEFPIEGPDGRKMSSSWGNVIAFSDTPDDMFGKVMSVEDTLVEKYFRVLTRAPLDAVKSILSGHPRDAKMRLACEIVAMYHGDEAARMAQEQFVRIFQKGAVPDDVTEVAVPEGTTVSEALVRSGAVTSKSEARRLISEGAVHNMDSEERVSGAEVPVVQTVYKVGKRRFVKVVIR